MFDNYLNYGLDYMYICCLITHYTLHGIVIDSMVWIWKHKSNQLGDESLLGRLPLVEIDYQTLINVSHGVLSIFI